MGVVCGGYLPIVWINQFVVFKFGFIYIYL